MKYIDDLQSGMDAAKARCAEVPSGQTLVDRLTSEQWGRDASGEKAIVADRSFIFA